MNLWTLLSGCWKFAISRLNQSTIIATMCSVYSIEVTGFAATLTVKIANCTSTTAWTSAFLAWLTGTVWWQYTMVMWMTSCITLSMATKILQRVASMPWPMLHPSVLDGHPVPSCTTIQWWDKELRPVWSFANLNCSLKLRAGICEKITSRRERLNILICFVQTCWKCIFSQFWTTFGKEKFFDQNFKNFPLVSIDRKKKFIKKKFFFLRKMLKIIILSNFRKKNIFR